jgi:hypothetical protein
MKWFLFYASCLNCKHYIPFGNDRFYDMGKCKLYPVRSTYELTERLRKDPMACGLDARNFTAG